MPRPTTTSRRLSSSRSNWPRSTFYRHLKLLREMQWIRVDQAGRRIVIRPIFVRNNQIVGRQLARTG
jgi:DNA-binding IclR family transcriptional regulator